MNVIKVLIPMASKLWRFEGMISKVWIKWWFLNIGMSTFKALTIRYEFMVSKVLWIVVNKVWVLVNKVWAMI